MKWKPGIPRRRRTGDRCRPCSEGDGGNAEIIQRRNPLREDRRHCSVFLQVDAANFAGAVIHIEVAGNFLLSGLSSSGPAGFRSHSGFSISSGAVESGTYPKCCFT